MFIPPQRRPDPGSIFEIEMLTFYHNIFEKERSGAFLDPLTSQKFLRELKEAYYYRQCLARSSSELNFHQPELRCSYIFQYAACFASITAHHFRQMLQLNPWLMKKVLLADTLNICTLGGGPATECVAIAKVLEEMLWRYCPRGERPLKINVTIVDKHPGWKETARKVNEALQYLVDTSVMKYRVSFLQADLTKPLDEELLNDLEKSDIVTMVKFMTTVQDVTSEEDISRTLQTIIQRLPEDGIFFFVDSSGFRHHDILTEVTTSPRNMMHQIHGHWESVTYTMSPLFLNECRRLYLPYYSGLRCCSKSRNYVAAWQKKVCSCPECKEQEPQGVAEAAGKHDSGTFGEAEAADNTRQAEKMAQCNGKLFGTSDVSQNAINGKKAKCYETILKATSDRRPKKRRNKRPTQ